MSRRRNKNSDNGEERKQKKANNLEIDYLSPLKIEKEYEKYGIDRQRLEIVKEFCVSIIYTCHKTYFGKDYIKTNSQIEEHFNWCFNNVNNRFKTIGISFNKTLDVYNYFFEHVKMHMYNNKKYNEETDLNMDLEYFKTITNYFSAKTEDDLLLLLDLDQIFKKSIIFVKN
jgi:hypothetical protein